MSLIPTIYSSADPGAPVLTGQAGSMAALLDAILVNGYGSGPSAKPSLGWTLSFTGTNLRAYRGNVLTGSGYFLRLDDTTTRSSRFRAYATMTAISTGTGITPTTAQRSNGSLWVKSLTTDATPKAWWAIGNERGFYLFVATDAATPTIDYSIVNYAGDLDSNKAGDAHRFFVSSTPSTAFTDSSASQSGLLFQATPLKNNGGYLYDAGFVGRSYTQSGASIPLGVTQGISATTIVTIQDLPYPDPVSGGLLWERAWLTEGNNILRGALPGLILPTHKRPFDDLAQITDLPNFPSGTALVSKHFVSSAPLLYGSYGYSVLFYKGSWA